MIGGLFDGPLDIVGDVHGELDALRALLRELGHVGDRPHPRRRRLVFVGDLVDRGPDSADVVALVRALVDAGRAQVIVGNHELNLLRGKRKHGNDWFWNEDSMRDRVFAPYAVADEPQRRKMLAWFDTLPLALRREDLRIVHAAWHLPAIAQAAAERGSVRAAFERWERRAECELAIDGLFERAAAQKAAQRHHFGEEHYAMPMLEAVGRVDEARQMLNPLRVLTSGIERCADAPFFANGQWRFARRVPWWDEYADDVAVVVGHFWRRYPPREPAGSGDADLFHGSTPTSWLGPKGRVFCVDYSVGGRYKERADASAWRTRLVALRWPERELVTDAGERSVTTGWGEAPR